MTVRLTSNAAPTCTPPTATSVTGAVRTAEGGRLRVDLSQVKLGLGTYWSGTVSDENTARRQVIVALVSPRTLRCNRSPTSAVVLASESVRSSWSKLPIRTGTLDLTLIDQTAPTPDTIKLLSGRIDIDTTTTFGRHHYPLTWRCRPRGTAIHDRGRLRINPSSNGGRTRTNGMSGQPTEDAGVLSAPFSTTHHHPGLIRGVPRTAWICRSSGYGRVHQLCRTTQPDS